MGWRDLLQTGDERIVLPWVGGRTLRSGSRAWTLEGKLPTEFAWYEFKITSRTATLAGKDPAPAPDVLKFITRGYLVGDRLVKDNSRVVLDGLSGASEPVLLIEPGLDRFVRITAGRTCSDGPLIYQGLDMPLGVEEAVLTAFLDEKDTVNDIPGIPPALDVAFRLETFQRAETKRRREELERVRLEEEAKRAQAERRRQLVEQLGDGAGRRQMAAVDFEQAARAALAIGGATYLDHRAGLPNEMVIRFRFLNRRFECTCDARTLRIIDSGICLTAHYDDADFEEGTKGDQLFTLESLPSVIREAHDDHKLVVYRHA